jgi:RNA polymerase sigma-70 factor (ECF subfamily)
MSPYTSDNELHCWEQLRKGEPSALGYFYDAYIDSLFIAALRVTGDRELAKDAMQEVFIELWTYRESLGIVRHSQSYLVKVLRNILFKKLRSQHLSDLLQQDGIVSPDENMEERIISADNDNEKRHKLKLAVSSLTRRQKEIIELRFNQGLSYDQIADHLQMNYQSVNNLAFRTLRRLRMSMSSLLTLIVIFY